MGDRNNPIKFGPEWLRNFATERRTGGSTSTGANTVTSSTVTTRTGSNNNTATNMGASGGGAASNNSTQPSNSHHNPKVLLAKLRYGREEMLALYDKDTAEAPACLKYNELLYKPREKPPLALNSTFDEEIRDSMRNNQPTPINALDRLGPGRVRPGTIVVEGRGRGRLQYYRQSSTGRVQTWNTGPTRPFGYSVGPEDEPPMARSWGSNSSRPKSPTKNGVEVEWASARLFRSKRNTNMAANNWRVQSRDDSEEWRAQDSRPRSMQDKRDRNWNERPVPDKNSWNSNRRTWVGGGTQNEENLPEWAVGNAEANPGTFDSSGAFHGYSNDDSSIVKNQEPSYQLTRSHTHASFARSKTEDGSEEWWTSEKANKLSAKKFDASEVKFKRVSFKQPLEAEDTDASPSTSTDSKSGNNKEESAFYDNRTALEKDDKPTNASKPPESNSNAENYNPTVYKPKYNDSKTLDELMMSDMNLEETNERSNFQSVLIAPNNSLRQKHQNIVSAESDLNKKAPKRGYLQMLHRPANQQPDEEEPSPQSPEDKLVDEIFDMTLDEKNHQIAPCTTTIMMNSSTSNMSSGMSVIQSMAQISNQNIHMGIPNSTLTNPALLMNASSIPTSGIHSAIHQLPVVQRMNSNLNSSMGLQMEQGNGGIQMGMPLHGVAHNHPMGPNSGISNTGMGPGMQPQGIIGFSPSSAMPPISSADSNKSLFLGQNINNSSMPTNDIRLPNHGGQSNMFPMHGLQQRPNLQSSYGTSLYTNIMRPPPAPTTPNSQNMAEQWYYEDPKKITQGPFSSKEMYTWYRAGFFGPSLMVRRAIDTHMRPLGSYGPVVPFAQDLLSPFPLAGFDTRPTQGTHDSMLNSQNSLAIDNMMNMGNISDPNTNLDSMQFPSVGRMNNPPFAQQPMDYPWSQPTSSADLLWMQQMMEGRNESRVSNLPMFFWDHQQLSSLPQPIKEMKTEDQILAQIKANQNIITPSTQNSTFFNDHMPVTSVSNKSEDNGVYDNASLSLEELQKLIQTDVLTPQSPRSDESADKQEPQPQVAKVEKGVEQTQVETSSVKQQVQNKASSEPKQVKTAKADTEKTVKNKDTGNTKSKNKNKAKDEKKDETVEPKKDDEVVKTEKRTTELSPAKSKKDEKLNKKDIEKEKKDWIKDGFTIVKGAEKSNKDKKKSDEAKAAEEAEKKRKEEEKLAAEEEKRKRQAEASKRQQEQLLREQHQRQLESMAKKAPWSTSNPAHQAVDNEGLTLAEIQRLEREKKLEQIKEQQQMMQMIAQQQAAALAREQEMQAGLGWAKKKLNSNNMQNQSLAEIQAEARKAAAAATVAASVAQVLEEPPAPLPTINHAPWGSAHNGGGFWDAQPNQPTKLPEKPQEYPKPIEQPKKKKVTVIPSTKKENSPVTDFESWCTGVLSSWSYKIDVPTFVGFLKDIESPYEVKDYVKCYLGESKESGDFARQFLEKRSKLLRVGMVTPSDDLCSPAAAINPRTPSGSDYQEVKGKGKKTKKNKMLKVDARILGFSVTASEDRINVGDIDTV